MARGETWASAGRDTFELRADRKPLPVMPVFGGSSALLILMAEMYVEMMMYYYSVFSTANFPPKSS